MSVYFGTPIYDADVASHPESKSSMAVVTFGGPPVPDSRPVFKVAGIYTADAVVWVADSQK